MFSGQESFDPLGRVNHFIPQFFFLSSPLVPLVPGNVCSSRMTPVPHPHTPGNMWAARCGLSDRADWAVLCWFGRWTGDLSSRKLGFKQRTGKIVVLVRKLVIEPEIGIQPTEPTKKYTSYRARQPGWAPGKPR